MVMLDVGSGSFISKATENTLKTPLIFVHLLFFVINKSEVNCIRILKIYIILVCI